MWSRALAGIIAGFFFSAAIVGLLSWCLPGPWQSTLVGGALAFFPLWMLTAAGSFLFANGKRAWWWLSGIALLLFAVFFVLRALHWIV